jgi:hypothetical protein
MDWEHERARSAGAHLPLPRLHELAASALLTRAADMAQHLIQPAPHTHKILAQHRPGACRGKVLHQG